ncbi:MAG: hypothetical protein A2161_03045 [Candidatus Schekmanbacteria bacterium RBG_13_48_7]|uniref:Uncharacterized protein n=1 Tax=Candidatus Schekmanbacteria bacterium RBG_13_48_7 TaxID=1817878 RepID=A0A1F7RXT8_9BACT|nr:MAG: hypothetical protein A2161_03045 [Candidatus Schekmanbacteria bacterium RBG_13_48_7]
MRIVRESITFKADKKETFIHVYCPLLGDIVLSGEKAEHFRQKLQASKEENLLFSKSGDKE